MELVSRRFPSILLDVAQHVQCCHYGQVNKSGTMMSALLLSSCKFPMLQSSQYIGSEENKAQEGARLVPSVNGSKPRGEEV